jgi:hypothetical protein
MKNEGWRLINPNRMNGNDIGIDAKARVKLPEAVCPAMVVLTGGRPRTLWGNVKASLQTAPEHRPRSCRPEALESNLQAR